MATVDKATKEYTKKLVALSANKDGSISETRVSAVIEAIKKKPLRQQKTILKLYLNYIRQEIRKSQATIEHAGNVDLTTQKKIASSLTKHYGRPISTVAKANADLIAGIRVHIGDDVYDSSVAGHLQTLATTFAR